MTTQKKTTKKPGRRNAAPAKVQSRSVRKVKALAIADAVLREDVSTGRRKAAPAKAQSRSAPEVKALAIADPVLREHVSQRNSRDGLMQVAFAWSPLGLLAAQTAFWAGLVGVAPRR